MPGEGGAHPAGARRAPLNAYELLMQSEHRSGGAPAAPPPVDPRIFLDQIAEHSGDDSEGSDNEGSAGESEYESDGGFVVNGKRDADDDGPAPRAPELDLWESVATSGEGSALVDTGAAKFRTSGEDMAKIAVELLERDHGPDAARAAKEFLDTNAHALGLDGPISSAAPHDTTRAVLASVSCGISLRLVNAAGAIGGGVGQISGKKHNTNLRAVLHVPPRKGFRPVVVDMAASGITTLQ